MKCSLCANEERLQQSHVIPEFLYKAVYDDKHRFQEIQVSDPSKPKYRQKGYREQLLCAASESRISKLERYASHVFTGAVATKSKRSGKWVAVTGLDYKQFKLFAYSILWKASVSRLPLFSEVRLGKHEEFFREALLSDELGGSDEYPVMLNGLSFENEPLFQLIVERSQSRMGGHRCYRFVFGGMIWVFIVSSHAVSKTVRQATLQENGSLKMMISEVGDVPFLAKQLKKMQEHWSGENAT